MFDGSVTEGKHSPSLCGSPLHLKCRSKGREASESRSGWWSRAELSPYGGAGSRPRPGTLALTRGMLRSRSHCRAHQRLPPLEEKGSIYLLDAADTLIYNQLLKKGTAYTGPSCKKILSWISICQWKSNIYNIQISLQHTSQRINMKQLGQLASYCNVRGTLTAPVGVKVSVEVDPDAAAALADRAVLPPHSVLRQKKSCFIYDCTFTK